MIQSTVNDFRPVSPKVTEGVLVNRQNLSTFVMSTLAKMEELLEMGGEVQSMIALKPVDKAFVRVWAEMGHVPGASDQLPEGDALPSDDAKPNAPVSYGIDREEIPRNRLIEALWPWFKRIEEAFSVPGASLTTELMVRPSLYGGDLVTVAFVEPHSLEEIDSQNTQADSAPVQLFVGDDGVTVKQEQLARLLDGHVKKLKEDLARNGEIRAHFEAKVLPDGHVRVAFLTKDIASFWGLRFPESGNLEQTQTSVRSDTVNPADPTITSEYQDQPQIQSETAADELDPASIAPLHSVGVRPGSKDEALADAESAELNRMLAEVLSKSVFLTNGPNGPERVIPKILTNGPNGPEAVTPMGFKKRMMLDGEVCIDPATNCFVDPKSVDTSKISTADGEDSDAAEYEYLKQYLQNSQQLHHGMAPEVIDLVLATESPSFWLKTGAVISELEAAFKQVCDNLTRDMSDEERYQLNPAKTKARNALLYFFKSPFDTSKFIAEAKEILRKEYGWPESLIDSKDWSHKRWAELQAEGHTAASVIQRYFPL